MSEPSQIAIDAAKNFELDHFGDWPGDDVAAVKFQGAIDAALKFHTEAFFVGLAEAAGKPVGSFKTGGEWIDHIKGQLADKDREIAELSRQIGTDFMAGVVIEHEKRIAEARRFIERIGTVGADSAECVEAAQKWLEGKP